MATTSSEKQYYTKITINLRNDIQLLFIVPWNSARIFQRPRHSYGTRI